MNKEYKIIPKNQMVDGMWYAGKCRNARVALWDAKNEVFVHIRYKFGYMVDTIEHFEDVKDKSVDGFIPIEKIETLDLRMVKKLQHDIGY